MWSAFLKLFPYIILIIQNKILQLNLKKNKNKNKFYLFIYLFMQFVLEVVFLECFFPKHSVGILGINEAAFCSTPFYPCFFKVNGLY
jgi:hypothetical protein